MFVWIQRILRIYDRQFVIYNNYIKRFLLFKFYFYTYICKYFMKFLDTFRIYIFIFIYVYFTEFLYYLSNVMSSISCNYLFNDWKIVLSFSPSKLWYNLLTLHLLTLNILKFQKINWNIIGNFCTHTKIS